MSEDTMVKGFTVVLKHDARCNGCGVMIGPHTDRKAGLHVKDGPVTGLFHSSDCYNQQREEVGNKNEII